MLIPNTYYKRSLMVGAFTCPLFWILHTSFAVMFSMSWDMILNVTIITVFVGYLCVLKVRHFFTVYTILLLCVLVYENVHTDTLFYTCLLLSSAFRMVLHKIRPTVKFILIEIMLTLFASAVYKMFQPDTILTGSFFYMYFYFLQAVGFLFSGNGKKESDSKSDRFDIIHSKAEAILADL